MHDGDSLLRVDRVRSFTIGVWHDTMESDTRANALIFIMIALAWIGLLRVSYLAVHPEHFVTQVAAVAEN